MDYLTAYIEKELTKYFDRLFMIGRKNGQTFDETKELLTIDNYSLLLEEVNELTSYFNGSKVIELFDTWIDSLES